MSPISNCEGKRGSLSPMGGRKGSEREKGRRSKWVRGREIKEVGGGKERVREGER